MFTGIIETTATVIRPVGAAGGPLAVRPGTPWRDLAPGESIAANGACLTVTGFDEDTITFDVVAETARVTNLGRARPGDIVNLERSLRVGDRFGGHYVLGHVDVLGTARWLRAESREPELAVSFPPSFARYLVPKGSIAVNGVSLTLGIVERASFTVYLIPFTLRETNLGRIRPRDPVNLEFDYFGKWVLGSHGGEAAALDEALDRAGFRSEEDRWSG